MTASPARAAGDVSDPAPSRLARRLGVGDAVVIGLGSMIGAGVFAAVGPAARAAGAGLLIGLVIAAVVAFCNATSSTALAVVYPASGGAYVYGRQRLGPFWGYLAGWGFVVGKIASCAAMALTVGAYAAPSLQRPVAVTAIFGLAAVNYRGIHKTAALTRLIVAVVLAALTVVVIGALFGGQASGTHFNGDLITGGWRGVLESAGLLFFAFAGYARIATLGEEVDDPTRTIPKAIPRALGITLLVYLVVAVSALAAAGPTALAALERAACHRGPRRRPRRAHPRGPNRWNDRRPRRTPVAHRRCRAHRIRHGRRSRDARLARRGALDAQGASTAPS